MISLSQNAIKGIHTSRVKSPDTPHEVVAAGGLSVVTDADTAVGVCLGGIDSDVCWGGIDIGVSLGRLDVDTSWIVTVVVTIVGAGRVVSLIPQLRPRFNSAYKEWVVAAEWMLLHSSPSCYRPSCWATTQEFPVWWQ